MSVSADQTVSGVTYKRFLCLFGWLHLAVILVATVCLCASEPDRPNVVLIVVDALRPDHLGCYGYERPTSPNIDRLAAEGIVFETVITQAPWTKTSFPSTLTSLYPFQHGVTRWESILPETLVTLPQLLGEAGYHTVCVVHPVNLHGRFGILRGFDEELIVIKGRRGALNATDKAISALETCSTPFFLMVHYFDTHKPYDVPDEYVDLVRGDATIEPFHWEPSRHVEAYERPSDEEIEGDVLLYDAGIRLADHGIGQIVEYLESRDLRQKTMIIVTADHGESFWEHGMPLHATNVYDEAIKVPLVMCYPAGFKQPMIMRDQARLIDLFPTIVDIAGLPVPEQCEGAVLVESQTDRRARRDAFLRPGFALCECTTKRNPATRCLRTRHWKIIVESLTSSIELYNLMEDPGETANLWGKGIAFGDTLLSMIRRVPTVELRGWRLAFTELEEGMSFQTNLSLPEGGRFSRIETLTREEDVSIDLPEDSTGCLIEVAGKGQHLILIDTQPPGVPVGFEVAGSQGTPAVPVYAVRTGQMPMGKAFVLDSTSAIGAPESFGIFSAPKRQGVHIWWMSGDELRARGKISELSPEEKRRLKSLGYIH